MQHEMTDEERNAILLRKQARITAEKRRLNGVFKKIDDKQKKAVSSLIDNAAFMAVTLQDLQEAMNINGVVSEYQNGENQWGPKKSPEVEIYNTMIKNYSSIIKQLADMLPSDSGSGDDELMKFLKR